MKTTSKASPQNLISTFASIFAALTTLSIIACTGKTNDTLTPFRKYANSGKGTQQKVDQKATQAALADGVLIAFDQDSVLKSATPDGVAFGARLKVNSKFPIYWNHAFKVKVGQALDPVQLDSSHGLGDLDLSLAVTVKRVNPTDKKTAQGFLVLQYELKQIKNENNLGKRSYLLSLVDLNRLKSTQPIY